MKFVLALLPLAALAISEDTAQKPLVPTSPPKGLTLDAIPLLGFGTWNLKEKNTSEAVSWAIQVGYRHIDCAAAYYNEEEVGTGIADGLSKTGLSRDDLWITSKLWNDHHDPELVEEALDTSLQKLGLPYLDLYHMHWPVASGDRTKRNRIYYLETWEAMTQLVEKGKTRHIGISNFSPFQLSNLLNHTSHPPSVHQMELHPYLPQTQWLSFHQNRSIHITAYSPLGGTNPTYKESPPPEPLLKNAVVGEIAKERGCSPAQVVLQWGMARGHSVIPKSIHKDWISENFRAPECVLEGEDTDKLNGLGDFHHRYNNPSTAWDVPLYEGLEDDDGKHGKARYWDEAH